jgi:septum formation protein
VAIYRLSPDAEISLSSSFTSSAKVTFSNLTDDDIEAYVASGEPMDKAGGYGIQGIGGQLVHDIMGDFFTVMGLPMHETSKYLAHALLKESED